MDKNNNIEEKALEQYADLLISKMEEMKYDWHKPWTPARKDWFPQNLTERRYNGVNMFLLALFSDFKEYKTPVFSTFKQIRDAGATVRKGEKGFPVSYYRNVIKGVDGKQISEDDYKALSQEEQQQCDSYRIRKYYVVFNLDQSTYPEVRAEEWEKIQDRFRNEIKDDRGMMKQPLLDYMLDHGTWICPIRREAQNSAFYRPSTDDITIPLKGQFDNGEEFYGTLLHEMAHSTGTEERLGRKMNGDVHDYGREELVAELTSAMTASALGVNKGIDPQNVAYLQGWIENIKEEPKFLKTVLNDVTKAGNMILERVDTPEIRERIAQNSIDSINRKIEENDRERNAPRLPVYSSLDEVGYSIGKRLSMAEDRDNGGEDLERHYQGLKEKHPDTLLLLRAGDDYHSYGADAHVVGELLGLEVTKDGRHMDRAAFPAVRLDVYLSKLIRAGHRVAICDMLEKPKRLTVDEREGRAKAFADKVDGLGNEKDIHNHFINKNLEDATMAKKTNDAQEQTEKKINKTTAKKAKNVQKPDGVWVSKLKDKEGNEIKGVYGLFRRENGEVGKPAKLSKEERDTFFLGTENMSKEEKGKVLAERAQELAKTKFSAVSEDKKEAKVLPDGYHLKNYTEVRDGKEQKVYFMVMVQNGETSKQVRPTPEQIRDYLTSVKGQEKNVRDEAIKKLGDTLFPNGFVPKEKKYELPVLSPEVRDRIQDAYIAKGTNGYYIKATIDNVERLKKDLDPVKDRKALDAYFRHFQHLPEKSDERAAAKKEAAVAIASDKRFYGDILSRPQKEGRGMSR